MSFFNLKNAILLSALCCASVYATVITPTPGGTSVSPGLTTYGSLGPLTLLAATTATFDIDEKDGVLDGSLETAVYETSGGTLDFFYQITEDAANTKAISDFGAPILDSFATGTNVSVYYLPVVGALPQPGSPNATFKGSTNGTSSGFVADWTTGNDSVTWLPKGMPTSTAVSTVFVMTTKATQYQSDVASLQGGNIVAGNLATFSPYSATPEPGFYGVLALGLAGLAFAGVRRRSAEKLRKS